MSICDIIVAMKIKGLYIIHNLKLNFEEKKLIYYFDIKNRTLH